MATKEEKDKSYADGVKDGKSDSSLGDIAQGLGLGSSSMNKDLRDSYDKGHDFGREHRYDGSQKDSSGKTSNREASSNGGSTRDRGDSDKSYDTSYSGTYSGTSSKSHGSIIGKIFMFLFIAVPVVLIGSCASSVFFHYNPITTVSSKILSAYGNMLVSEKSNDHMVIYKFNLLTLRETEFTSGNHPVVSHRGRYVAFFRKTWLGDKVFVADANGNNIGYLFPGQRFYWGPQDEYIIGVTEKKILMKGGSFGRYAYRSGKISFRKDVRLGPDDFIFSPQGLSAFVVRRDSKESLYIKQVDFDRHNEVLCCLGKKLKLGGWSPDSKKMVIYSHGQTHILSFNNGYGAIDPRDIKHLPLYCRELQWSPDGNNLIYSRAKSDYIWLTNYNTESSRSLTIGHSPVWSPDSQKILFKCVDDLYCIDIHNGNRKFIAKNVADGYDWLGINIIFFARNAKEKS